MSEEDDDFAGVDRSVASEMVERMCRAFARRYFVHEYPTQQSPDEAEEHWEEFKQPMNRALAAIREPTEAMINAALFADAPVPNTPANRYRAGYRAMIDAALKAEP